MPALENPFELVYKTLWTMLEEDHRFTDEVKHGNRLKFHENERSPVKTQMTAADYPEVALVAEGVTGNLCNTSSTSMLRRNYSWVISAGDYRYSEIIPLEWAIFSGMIAWKDRLGPLTWEGSRFVTQANITDSNFSQVDSARRRGIEGWVAVWSIFVEMQFANSLIRGSHLS